MVYYPSLPLIMKSEQKTQQFCTKLGNGETHLYVQPSTMSGNNVATGNSLNNGTLLITSNNQATYNQGTVKLEKHQDQLNGGASDHHLFQNSKVQSLSTNGRTITTGIATQANNRSTAQGTSTTPTKPQFRCDQCNMIFGSKSAHTSHIKSHLKNQESNYSIATNSNVTMASTSTASISQTPQTNGSNGGDPYRCDVCQKTFAVPARLIRHYRTHTGERPFKCEFCDKMFSVKENLQVHRRIHTKERPYKCDVCGRAFEHSGKLHRHMRIHTGERPHKCSVCGKTFIQSGQLVIHMRTHTGEKPYKCPVEGCGKGFTCSKQLKVHSRTHTGEKPYHCDICSRDFGYNHVLKLHRVQHYGSKCYKCTICDETFKSKKEMEAHIKGHANEIPDDDEEQQQQQQQTQQMDQTPSPSIESQSPLSENLQQIDNQIQQHTPSNIKQETNNSNRFKESMILSSPQASSSSVSVTSFILETDQSHDSGIANSVTTTIGGIPLDMTTNEQRSNLEILEQHSDDEMMYSNIYHRYQSQLSPTTTSYNVQSNNGHPTINPALLAAASIASRKVVEEANNALRELSSSSAISSESNDNSREAHEMSLSEYYKNNGGNSSDGIAIHSESSPEHFQIDSIEVLRNKGFFTPAVPVAEYRSTLHHNDIVRQVEAAIAGAGLSPPRSISTESPDRSSSPESDTMLMADRDVMTLPLRKRKLYLNETQTKDAAQTMRMSSVIQFAKAKGVS